MQQDRALEFRGAFHGAFLAAAPYGMRTPTPGSPDRNSPPGNSPTRPPQALAQALSPCVAWLPAALRPHRTGSLNIGGGVVGGEAADEAAAGERAELEGEDLQAVVLVFEALINRFANIYG